MPVMIRLAQAGKRKDSRFHVVVMDKAKRRNGGYLERIGSYNPTAKDEKAKLQLNLESFKKWHARGAQVTDTIARLLKFATDRK